MKPYTPENLDPVFAALANPVRRSILSKLASGPQAMLELSDGFDMSFQAVSKHLKVLEHADLVSRKKQGKFHYFEYQPAALNEALHWISFHSEFWQGSFDSLETFLSRKKPD